MPAYAFSCGSRPVMPSARPALTLRAFQTSSPSSCPAAVTTPRPRFSCRLLLTSLPVSTPPPWRTFRTRPASAPSSSPSAPPSASPVSSSWPTPALSVFATYVALARCGSPTSPHSVTPSSRAPTPSAVRCLPHHLGRPVQRVRLTSACTRHSARKVPSDAVADLPDPLPLAQPRCPRVPGDQRPLALEARPLVGCLHRHGRHRRHLCVRRTLPSSLGATSC